MTWQYWILWVILAITVIVIIIKVTKILQKKREANDNPNPYCAGCTLSDSCKNRTSPHNCKQ